MRSSFATSLALALTLGCGSDASRDLREWTPSDHQPPEGETGERGGAPDEVDVDPAVAEARAATSLFGAMCGECHGPEGRGDGPGRPPVAQVPDFTTAAWQASRTDEQLATSIAEGRGGFMPAFGDRLSPEGVQALVRHVRRLGGALPPPGGADPSGAGSDVPADAPSAP